MHLDFSFLGVLGSVMALVAETLRWKSYGQFSIATKVPVQIFGLKGPLALVSLFLYLILAILLATETGTSTVFYLCCSWSVLYFDLAMALYDSWKAMFAHKIDILFHFTNIMLVIYSFEQLTFVPVTFILGVSGLWGVLVLTRVMAKKRSVMQAQQRSLNSKSKASKKSCKTST